MIETILGIIAVLFVLLGLPVFTALVLTFLEDVEMFRAIDEKVARFIKGEDEESEV